MKKILLLFILLNILLIKLIGQDYNSLIIEKFRKDIGYTNLYFVEGKKKINPDDKNAFDIDHLIAANGQKVYFQKNLKDEFYTYKFYFLKSTDPTNPIIPVIIEEVSEKILISPDGKPISKSAKLLFFKPADFVELKSKDNNLYKKVTDFIVSMPAERLFNKSKIEESSEKISRDNTDFVNNARVNSDYFFFDSTYNQNDWYLDLSFSKLTFSYTPITKALGFSGVGFELSLGDRGYNMLPYQAPYIGWGGSFLINFGGNDAPLNDNFFVNFKFLVKSKIDNLDLVDKIEKNLSPVISMGLPKMNIQNGFAFELNTSRPFDKLPFLNFYYSKSGKDFKKPNITFYDVNGIKSAYFGTQEFEASLNYYFNLDKSKKNKIKVGIGVGGYEVYKVNYDSKDLVTGQELLMKLNNPQPLILLDYTFQTDNPETEPMFGGKARILDNRLNLTAWIKLLKTENFEMRFEDIFISDPFGRTIRSWETKGGNFVQLRSRFSF